MSPLRWLDAAFALVRALGLPFAARAVLAGAPLAGVVILAFYLERVEGIRDQRWLLALLLALSWFVRTRAMGHATLHALRALEGARAPASMPPLHATLGLSARAAFVLMFFSLLLVGLARHGEVAIVLSAFPLIAWPAVAPSWLVHAGVSAHSGSRAWKLATKDAAGLRFEALVVGTLGACGTLVLLANGAALVALVLQLFHSMLGLDIASVDAFFSPSNRFATLSLTLALLLLQEPFRLALALAIFRHARDRRDGADLRDEIEALRAPKAAARGATALLSIGLALYAPLARAEAPAEPPPVEASPTDPTGAFAEEAMSSDAPLPAGSGQLDPTTYGEGAAPGQEVEGPSGSAYDDAVFDEYVRALYPDPSVDIPPLTTDASDQQTAELTREILARPEFREFRDHEREFDAFAEDPNSEEEGFFAKLIREFFEWLFENDSDVSGGAPIAPPALSAPPAWVFVTLAVLLVLAVLAYILATREKAPEVEDDVMLPLDDPRELSPDQHRDRAAALAAAGRYREAFRALYLASLVSLDRRGDIRFDPARTNWHYLRQLRASALRAPFREFTGLFDRFWYGLEPASQGDYQRGRDIVELLMKQDRGDAGGAGVPPDSLNVDSRALASPADADPDAEGLR